MYRSIPAWAGETNIFINDILLSGVYPRVGGGNPYLAVTLLLNLGLSPRGRGKRRLGLEFCAEHRSIPAWAGETRQHCHIPPHLTVYPRVGGGNAAIAR